MTKGPSRRRRGARLSAAAALAACATLFAAGHSACAKSADGVDARQTPAAQTPAAPAQPSPAQEARPARIAPGELSKLRWIEGGWRGTGDIDKPFFERYTVEPGAVVVEGFEDEAFGKSTGATRFELKDGEMGGGNDGWRWAVTKLEEGAVTFEPVAKARNSFRWERVSADEWRAVLEWPAAEGKPARRRVYKMERWPAPGPSTTPSTKP